MARRPITPERMLDNVLDLVARQGWSDVGLTAMATAAEVPLGTFLRHYPSRGAVMNAFARKVDLAMLAATEQITEGESARDRLFEALMRRFDAMRPDKEAARAMVRDLTRRPLRAVCRSPRIACSMALTLEAAGLGASGLQGLVRIKGLALIYLDTLRVWLDDDSEDMGKTMAALDRRLGQADRTIATLCWRPRSRASATSRGGSEPKPA